MDKHAVPICLVGDYDPKVTAHQAIPKALALAAKGNPVEPMWLGTERALDAGLEPYAGFWCVPASPYRSMEGALRVIRFARETGKPFLGTCAGCQHAILEFARNVLHMTGAGHTECDPATAEPVITQLTCSLVEVEETLHLTPASRLRQIYGVDEIRETYHCRFGPNPAYVARLIKGGLKVGATGPDGEVRAVELPGHRFFFGTLFQPERSALKERTHPLITALVAAASSAAAAGGC
ncbi:MAG: gamma-glutamyl-gamma-aminobutyrate hydrolase family protein [Terriglobales bacterium]